MCKKLISLIVVILTLAISGLSFGANEITGVTIEDFYQEHLDGRYAVHLIDESGLHINGPNTHTTTDIGYQWSSGSFELKHK